MSSTNLRNAGLKVTLPRLKILEILTNAQKSKDASNHLSAESIHLHLLEAGEEVGLATVYRVLTQFEKAGLVKRHNFDSAQSVFELDDSPHDHLICVHCGRIDEFSDKSIHEHQQLIAKRLGYQLTEHTLTLYGVCEKCQKSQIQA